MDKILGLITQLILIVSMVLMALGGADIRWLVYAGFIYLGAVINSKED